MGNHYRQVYTKTVLDGSPSLWAAPPTNVIASDLGETLVHAIFAGCGTWLLAGGIQYLVSGFDIDMTRCAAWAGVASGVVILAPILSNVAADLACDIRQGWNRGAPPDAPDPEPVAKVQVAEPSEEERGAARIEGEWWYPTHRAPGHLACYATPRNKSGQLMITDVRMRKIFGEVTHGTPFSEREIKEKVSGLSGPRFRILQHDWRKRNLYVIGDDNHGHFTAQGRLIAGIIAANDPTAPGQK